VTGDLEAIRSLNRDVEEVAVRLVDTLEKAIRELQPGRR
jgi:hypothetical protein